MARRGLWGFWDGEKLILLGEEMIFDGGESGKGVVCCSWDG